MARTPAVEHTTKISETFDSADAEVAFKSSDGVVFRIREINLRACAEGFSAPGGFIFGEVVELSEPASILELLFQFIYPIPKPDLGSVSFEVLNLLTEAAEKYRVYAAMAICQIYMMDALSAHPLTIFAYAAKHNYRQILAKAAPLVLEEPLTTVLEELPPALMIPWVDYYQRWMQVSRNALTLHLPAQPPRSIVASIAAGPNALRNLDSTFSLVYPEPSKTPASDGKIENPQPSPQVQAPPPDYSTPAKGDFWGAKGAPKPDYTKPAKKGGFFLGSDSEGKDEMGGPKESGGNVGSGRGGGGGKDGSALLKQVDTLLRWRQAIEADIGKIPEFTTLLAPASTTIQVDLKGETRIQGGQVASSRFFYPDAEVQLKSCDGVLFQIHRLNLAACAPSLSLLGGSLSDVLLEPSDVLNLLFQFIYPIRQPDIQPFNFATVRALADAAEKYAVYSAIETCRIYMKKKLPQHPNAILAYGTKYKYYDIADLAAPQVIDRPLQDIVVDLPSETVIPWIRYYEQWTEVVRTTLAHCEQIHPTKPGLGFWGTTSPKGGVCKCTTLGIPVATLYKLGKGVPSLKTLDEVFASESTCVSCGGSIAGVHPVRAFIERRIRAIPPFSTFVSCS